MHLHVRAPRKLHAFDILRATGLKSGIGHQNVTVEMHCNLGTHLLKGAHLEVWTKELEDEKIPADPLGH